MKKIVLFICIIIALQSCAVVNFQSVVAGTFVGNTQGCGSFVPSGKMILSINSDRKFEINWLEVDYTGIWTVLDEDQVLLKFDTITDISILLRSGTLSGEDLVVDFINKDKVKVNGNILKRIK